jgi:hypothetical protein
MASLYPSSSDAEGGGYGNPGGAPAAPWGGSTAGDGFYVGGPSSAGSLAAP